MGRLDKERSKEEVEFIQDLFFKQIKEVTSQSLGKRDVMEYWYK